MATEPFFHSSDTHRAIQDISEWPSLTLYLGAGAAVDRTGLTWQAMIGELLRYVVPEEALRDSLVRQYDPAKAASIASDLYEVTYGPSADVVLRSRIRELLYGPREMLAGKLLTACSNLAVDFFMKNRAVCIVTTNYDVFIREELQDRLAEKGLQPTHIREFHAGECSAAELQASIEAPEITLLYLHGLVTRDGLHDRKPVLSELDYHRVAAETGSLLQEAIRGRNFLMVGSSLTDPPLLDALHETLEDPLVSSVAETVADGEPVDPSDRTSRPQRVALLPLQGSEWDVATPQTIDGLTDLGRNRAHHFGVQVIYPDYFFQVGQLVNEVGVALDDADGRYDEYVCERRYGSRLVDWWNGWLGETRASEGAQRNHHAALVGYLDEVRLLLGAPPSESLRLEVWVRWHPESERTLCLWASSVGTWRDPDSMRRDSIKDNSHFRSVRVFCIGSPAFFVADKADETRWRTYLGVPLWLQGAHGLLQIGVITMASTRSPANSSLTAKNTMRVGPALPVLIQAGMVVATAS